MRSAYPQALRMVYVQAHSPLPLAAHPISPFAVSQNATAATPFSPAGSERHGRSWAEWMDGALSQRQCWWLGRGNGHCTTRPALTQHTRDTEGGASPEQVWRASCVVEKRFDPKKDDAN